MWDIKKSHHQAAQVDTDFGFYHPADLDMIAMCAVMLRQYHIPPSITLAQDKHILSDVLTLLRLWDNEETAKYEGDKSIW